MGWLRDKIFNEDIRCFLLLCIIGILEILNLELLRDMPYGVSIIISVILLIITTYLIGMQFMILKDRFRNYLHKNHLELVTKLENVAQELSETENKLSEKANNHFKDLVVNLNALDEKLYKSVNIASETICATIESSEKNLVSVLNKNKEDVLEDAKTNAELLIQDILQQHQNTSKLVNHVKEQIVEEVKDRSQQIQIDLGQTEKAISEMIHSEGKQTSELIVEVRDRLTNSLDEMKEQNIKATDNVLNKYNQMNQAVIESMKSEGSQMGILIEGVREQLESKLRELIEQSAKSAEEIIERATRSEETVIASIQSESNQSSLLIGEVRDRLTSSLGEMKEQNIQATDKVLDKSNQTEKAVIESMKSENTQMGILIDGVRDHLASTLGELKEQNVKSAKEIIERAIRTEETFNASLQSESKQIGTLIGEINEQLASSFELLIEESDKLTKEILGNTIQTGEAVISSMKLEGNQIGMLLGEVREQLSVSLVEIKEQNGKSTEEILSKTNQDYLLTANGINEGLEKLDKEIKEQVQMVNDGITRHIDTISSLIQETSEQLKVLEVTSKEELNLLNKGIETQWNQVANRMDSFDSNNANRFNRTIEMFESAMESMKMHTDQGAHYTTSKLIETIEHLSDQNLSKISTTIFDMNQTIGQTVDVMENNVLEKMEWISKEQVDLKSLIAVAIQNEKESKDNVINHINHLDKAFTSIQNKSFQHVLDQFSAFRKEHMDSQNENKDKTERKFSSVNQKINGLTTNLSSFEQNIEKAISQINSWRNEEIQKGDKLFAMLSKVNTLDTNFEKATKLLFEQQETFGLKVDALSSRITSINALIKVMKSNEVKENEISKSVSIIGTQKEKSRIEKIQDDENGLLIVNKYEHDVLSNSEMYQNGKKVYFAEYDRKGNMISSKNFDQFGKVMTEMTYFPNGAIKERKENVKRNGKVITQISEFNQNGKKIK